MPNNYTTGAIYTFSTKLPAGTDFWYYFRAMDGWQWATGPPTIPIDAPDVISDNPPVAVAQASPTSAFIGDDITFDATASTDDFGITAYLWNFGDMTTDTNPVTTHAYTSHGTFLAILTVWDTANQSDTDTVSISIGNRPPIADAGPDQSVNKSEMVTLNGTGSNDPDGDPLTYLWNQTGGPPVVLAGADTVIPTFSSTVSGTCTFLLTVDDGWGGSSNDTVNVTVVNRAPIADAGPDQTVPKKTMVTLNGTGSSDPDGDILTYAWSQTGGPIVLLSGADTVNPTFTPPESGIYTFQLTVDDGDGGVSSDTVDVTATNTAPVADAGPDQTVQKKTLVTLDGSLSFDSDGDPLTYAWTQTSGPAVTLTGADTATPTFTPPKSGLYTFQLTVDDNDGGIATDTVIVTATNVPPVADAGSNQTVQKNTLVTLNGSLSFDSDNDVLTFSWIQLSGPAVTLTDADTPTPTFTPSRAGTYIFRLSVDDGDGGTSEDTVTVTVWGLSPTADLVADTPTARIGEVISFDGSGSTDPDGTIADFEFSFGDNTSANGTEAVREHSYASAGTYTVILTVTDDDGNTSSAQVTVEVTEMPPPEAETNYKPIVAVMFAIILLVAGVWSSRRRPWKGGNGRMAVAKAFAFTCLPFILAEIMTGILSVFVDPLKIPPVIGWGTGVDVLILVAGVLFSLLRLARKDGGMKPQDTNAREE
jgi:PKD repeat protein